MYRLKHTWHRTYVLSKKVFEVNLFGRILFILLYQLLFIFSGSTNYIKITRNQTVANENYSSKT